MAKRRSSQIKDPDDLLIVEEVASRLRVKCSWVYDHADDLGAYRVGKYLRFSWDRVLERLEGAGPQRGDDKGLDQRREPVVSIPKRSKGGSTTGKEKT